jgi:hypothetical protein
MHAHDRTHRCNLLNLMNKILNSAISPRCTQAMRMGGDSAGIPQEIR